MTSRRSDKGYGIRTILLAETEGELRRSVADLLGKDAYNVLEAHDQATALHVIKTHSRRIDLLVIGESMNVGDFAALLQQYQAGMSVMLITALPDCSVRETVLPNIRESVASALSRSGQLGCTTPGDYKTARMSTSGR